MIVEQLNPAKWDAIYEARRQMQASFLALATAAAKHASTREVDTLNAEYVRCERRLRRMERAICCS